MKFIDYLLAPFFFVIKEVFLFSYSLTGNYGISIILLSFAISLLLLPVFIFIERTKKRDDAVKRRMKPMLDEIKRCYRGQERYYYIRTLHRQHGYSSLKSLIPLLSLLLQIPFFIAAYQFLEHYEPLAEQSFLFLKDLSEPDRLLGSINILPIIMTVVNLVTAYFYTRNGDTSERKQMLVVAGVFLVLLYNFPSGLVLYWTMNNVFSFFRLFVTNPEVFKRTIKPGGKLRFSLSDLQNRFFTILQKGYRIGFRSILSSRMFLSLLFLTTYFYLGSKFYFGGVNNNLGIIAFVSMLISQIAGLVYFIYNFKNQNKIWSGFASIGLILLLGFQCLKILALIAGREIVISILNIEVSVSEGGLFDVVLPGILFISIIALFISKRGDKKDTSVPKSNWPLYILSILYLLGFIFLWNPIAVYSSYPANFDFTAFDVIKNNFLTFAAAFIILAAIYYILSRKAGQILLIILTTAVVLSFVHNTIAPIDMGTLQDAVFLRHDNLAQPLPIYLLESFGILVIFFGVQWCFKRGYHKQFRYALIALNIILISQSLVVAGGSGSFFQKENTPPDPSSSISFSKDRENIVLLILDMFHGWYVNKAIEEVPDLTKIYDGFVWYPNSLSVSNITGSSIGPILGGYDYTIDILNQDATRSVEQKITEIASDFNEKIRDRGYRYSGNHITYTQDDSLTYDTYLPKWHDHWDIYDSKLNIGVIREVGYTLLWNNAVFYSAPLILKPIIYNQGQWLQGKVTNNENTSRTMPYNLLRLLPHISDSKSTHSNFIYLYSPATHHPWDIIDGNGIIQTDVTPYENNKWALETLSEWIEWMKKNEVYDNTKIIIVSDHGPHWWFFKGDVDMDIPVIQNDKKKKINEASMGLFSLMLVKDFHAKGELKKDWRFMSNADASAIIFNENDPTKEEPPQSRTLPSSEVRWERKLWEMNQLRIIMRFEVTDDMYNLNNWKIVD